MRDKSTQTTKGNAERTAELLREKIRSGELSNEGKIPSIRKLADLPGFGDRNAIWRALLTLKEERYLTTTPAGRYLVHPRFLLNHSAQKTLTVAFVGVGESALNNAFIQSIHTALASNQDGYNIQLDLRLVSPTNQPQVTDLHSYDAIILTDRWSLPLFKALKQKGKLVTSLVAPRRFEIPCGVQIDDLPSASWCLAKAITTRRNGKHPSSYASSAFVRAGYSTASARALSQNTRCPSIYCHG